MGFLVFEGFYYLVFLVFSIYKNPKPNHRLPFLAIFLIWKCYSFGLKIVYARSINYTSIFDLSEILDNIYIWVLLVNSRSVLLLAFVKFMFYSHCIDNCIFLYFLEAKNTYFVIKYWWNYSYICVFILSKNTAQLILEKLY